ncbi:MAG: CcmD family protein [Deltaproteobacteria bacterium]|nr:CcmD family protein [Deltaproteobacteria bacterium]
MLGDNWVLAANLVIWTGLFVYLLYLGTKIRDLEKDR